MPSESLVKNGSAERTANEQLALSFAKNQMGRFKPRHLCIPSPAFVLA
jgi:hypothetical protein